MSADATLPCSERGAPNDPARGGDAKWLPIAACLLAISLTFRFLWLDTLPGINGDEAYLGVQVERFVHGEAHSFRTPNRLFVNPVFIVTESLLLSAWQPSFWLLRLPIAVWACLGLLLNLLLHRWVYRDWHEAVLVTVLLGALPLHLAYSRCGWDPSFLLLTTGLMFYPCLMVAEGRSLKTSTALWFVGAVLSLWAHMSAVLFIVVMIAAVFWVRRGDAAGWLGTRTALRSPRLALGIAVIGGVSLATAAFTVLCSLMHLSVAGTLTKAATDATKLLRDPISSAAYVALLGDLLAGERAYVYFVGAPRSPLLDWIFFGMVAAAIYPVVRLARSERASDRALGVFWLCQPLMLIASVGLIAIHEPSNERYALYLLHPAAAVLVRCSVMAATRRPRGTLTFAAPLVLSLSALLLFQFWTRFIVPLREQTYAATLHRAFRTGSIEPKAAVARLIRERSRAHERVVVVAEDWWLQHPLQYLLGSDYVVEQPRAGAEPGGNAPPRFVVGFTGSRFLDRVCSRLTEAGLVFEQQHFAGGDGQPVLTVLCSPTSLRESAAASSDAQTAPGNF